MDKINVALSATEDNAAAIRELNKTLLRRTKCRLVAGTAANGVTSFGQVASDGGVGVVITFSGASATLMFGNVTVISATSPIIAVLPAGTAEVKLSSAQQSSSALIIGG